MAVNPSETPEHSTEQPSDEQPDTQSSLDRPKQINSSGVPPAHMQETTGSSAENSWSDTSWSGVQPNQVPTTPSDSRAPSGSAFATDGAETLRGRADSLLDEMMLGAVDLSAGGPTDNAPLNAAPPNQPPINEYNPTQSPQNNLSGDYAADLGGPVSPNMPTQPEQAQPEQDSASPPTVHQILNQPQTNYQAPPAGISSQMPRPQFEQLPPPPEQSAYPTVSQEMSNRASDRAYQSEDPASNYPTSGNLTSNYPTSGNPTSTYPTSGNPTSAEQLYGQQSPVGQSPPMPQGQLYPPSSAGAAYAHGQPSGQPSGQAPFQPAAQPPAYQQPTQNTFSEPPDQPTALRPPSVSTTDPYPAQQPPSSSFSYPDASPPPQPSGGYSFGGPSSTDLSSMSYFEQQRLSYAERYAFEREQERKQWSIATGKANDYLSSVPRYPRESRDELGQPNRSPYNPAASLSAQAQHPSQYQPGPYPPQGQPAQYQPGHYQPEYYQPAHHQAGQHQPYPQPSPYPTTQPQQHPQGQPYQQGQYASSAGYPPNAPPSYQGHIPELGPVVPGQQRTSPFADAMSVGTQARQMDLLPRETKMNVQALQEEMLALHTKIDTSLPIGHDTADRARHLLDKGRAILEQDPYRSAEVSYYVQQVKAILERAKQRTQWSNMYRTRLLYYLLGWFFLSITALASVLIYADQLRTFLAPSGVDPNTTILGQHGVPFLATIAAGILGTTIAALLNMWRYSQRDYGFFDRKYGLLGIVLPIISLLFGTVVYLIFGFIAELFNIPPSSNLLISVVPAVIAFAFGAAQERIYGTSD